jgi:sugar-specific transcriptional regulator TrmB
LEDLKRRGVITEVTKNEVKYYSAISPDLLFKKWEEKYEKIKSELPELLAITNKLGNRPRTQFFEGFE